MLACGNPEQMGYVESRWLHGGQGEHVVAMSGQSSLCLRCAKVYTDHWVSQVSTVLHEGVISRPLILTVPALLRPPFSQNATVVLSALMRCGAQCLDAFYSPIKGKTLHGGSIIVLHTHGRNGHYHPQLHGLAPSGGSDGASERWEPLSYLPSALLRRQGQWPLLTMLRQTLKTEAINPLVDACFTQYPNGLVTNVQQGAVPAQAHSVARSVAKDVVSPPISVRRIERYAGARVTYHSRSHRTDRMAHETVDGVTFIGRMVPHVRPKGFKRIRSYGVQATKTFAKIKWVMQAGLAKVEEVVKGTVKLIARLTSRQRYEQSTGRDPCQCPHCGAEMAVWRIWHPTYGVIYDEGEVKIPAASGGAFVRKLSVMLGESVPQTP